MNKKKKPRALIFQGFVACFACTKSAPNYKEYEKYVEWNPLFYKGFQKIALFYFVIFLPIFLPTNQKKTRFLGLVFLFFFIHLFVLRNNSHQFCILLAHVHVAIQECLVLCEQDEIFRPPVDLILR